MVKAKKEGVGVGASGVMVGWGSGAGNGSVQLTATPVPEDLIPPSSPKGTIRALGTQIHTAHRHGIHTYKIKCISIARK